jgi:hypothetical protein
MGITRWVAWQVRAASAAAALGLICGGLTGIAGPASAAGRVLTGAVPTAATCHGDGGTFGNPLLDAAWPGGFTGVPVYSNGSNPSYVSPCKNYADTPGGRRILTGIKWQCVELINRLYVTKGWINTRWTGDGDELYDDPPVSPVTGRHLVTQPQGSISYLAPGDVISFYDTAVTGGHAAVVSEVSGSAITFVNQNTSKANVVSHGTLSAGKLTMKGWKHYIPIGVIHAPWTAAEAPLPANAVSVGVGGTGLNAVACPSASSCVAAGGYYDSSSPYRLEGLLLTKTGSAWTPAEAPLPGKPSTNPDVYLGSVACPSASSCVAVGYYTGADGSFHALLVTGYGSTWVRAKVTVPGGSAGFNTSLFGVTCPAASTCVAVGGYEDGNGAYQGLILTGSGTRWTPTKAPLPADASTDTGVALNSVTCPSVSSCVAVGKYNSTSGEPALILTGSGANWSPTEGPAPAGASSQSSLTSVACPSASSCVASGYYYRSTSGTQMNGLLVTGSGKNWTGHKAQLPGPANSDPSADLQWVACPSLTSCVAAGSYEDSKEAQQGLLVSGSKSNWAPTKAPAPAGYLDAELDSVSCPSATSCVAVGHYDDSAGGPGMLDTKSGKAWTPLDAPLPADGDITGWGVRLNSVACPPASGTCITVGSYDAAGSMQGLLLTGPA